MMAAVHRVVVRQQPATVVAHRVAVHPLVAHQPPAMVVDQTTVHQMPGIATDQVAA
jgi:hypothetical protein